LVHVVLEDRDPAMLAVAAGALGQIGDVRAVEVLSTIAQDQSSHEPGAVQARVAFTLHTLQKNKRHREDVRKAAASALKQIKSSRRKSR
jgi:HEAT repeat protein